MWGSETVLEVTLEHNIDSIYQPGTKYILETKH